MHLFGTIMRRMGTGLLWIVILLCIATVIVPHFLDRLYYRGPVSAHYDGAHFFNPEGDAPFSGPGGGGRDGVIGYFLRGLSGTDTRPRWPDAVAVKPMKPAPFAAPRGMRATWVGHATVLVQAAGLNILTDPVWSDHASPFPPLGPRRVAAPGIRFDDLPKIDLVLISHNHYDHLDIPTLKKLWARDKPVIVTALGNESLLAAHGIPARGLDWGQSATGAELTGKGAEWAVVQCGEYEHCPDYRVRAIRNHHWSSRWGVDRNRALWSAFLVETRAGRIFFAGDTGAGDMRWADQARAEGPIRLAIIPIGAFRFAPGQMEDDAHIGPRTAVTLFRRLGATTAIPIHWGTFRLSWEGWNTPPRMLELELACAGIARKRFAPVRFGRTIMIPGTADILPEVPRRCDPKAIAALE